MDLSGSSSTLELIDDIISGYIKTFPDERRSLAQLIDQVIKADDLNNRKTLPGHVTASAVVLSPERDKILLVRHKALDKWLQPGGHWEPSEANPWRAAAREAVEEAGVELAEQLPVTEDQRIPLDINTHQIPANEQKGEPAHLHHDFRYVFVADNEALTAQEAEVSDVAFVSFDDARTEHIASLISKLRALDFISEE